MRAKSDSRKNGEEGQQNSLSESPGLKNIYQKWLEHEHKSNTKESRNSYSWPLTAKYEGTIIETSENVKYETIFEYFLSLGNYDWIDRILEELNPKKDSKLSSNQKTYAKRLREFLEGAARCHKFPRPDNIEIKPAAADSKNPKLKVQYPKFEGMLSLLDKLSVSEIIDITFKNSIFFDKETAKTHFVDLEQKCKEKDNVTARGNLKKCPQYTLNNDDIKKRQGWKYRASEVNKREIWLYIKWC